MLGFCAFLSFEAFIDATSSAVREQYDRLHYKTDI
jgi:hypothetical protein